MVAIGHMSMKREILGYEGWRRPTGSGDITQAQAGTPAAWAAGLASGFLGFVSDRAMAPTFGARKISRS